MSSTAAPLYQVPHPADAVVGANPDRFFDSDYTEMLSAMIAHVVDHEGPVLDAVLARRIARSHVWLRTGVRIREHVLQLARARHRTTDEDVGVFYWPGHLETVTVPPFRAHADEDSVRPVDEICLPELTSLARLVTERDIQDEAVYHAMLRELGIQQLRAAGRARLAKAMHVCPTIRPMTK